MLIEADVKYVVTVVALLLAETIVYAQSGQLLGSLSTENKMVSGMGSFEFDLVTSGPVVAQTDYLEILLPEDHGGYFINYPQCNVESASVSECDFVSSKIIHIYFNYFLQTTVVKGYVTNFVNPPSTRGMENVKITLM